MRRLIAYIVTALAMLLAIGVAATPVITKLNAGREYTSGKDYREIVFNVAETGNTDKDEDRASVITEEMKTRLNDYNVEDYSIKVQGEDTVAVALDMSKDLYNYAAKYLAFSGESFALVSSNGKPESVRNEHKLFNPEDVRIEYKDDVIPVIVIPVTDEGKADIEELVNEFNTEEEGESGTSRLSSLRLDSDEGEEEKQQNLLYLWANFNEDRGEGMDSLNSDPIAKDKVLMAFDASNIWYDKAKKDENAIAYYCARGKEDDQTQLDISGLEDDNARANYLVGLLKASKYEFDLSCPTVNISETSGIDYYTNARVLSASAEPILSLGNNIYIKMSKTFIAFAIAIVIVSLLLIVYYRLNALAIIATTLGTLFVTLISFTSMHVLFNIPAVVGFIILSAGVLFGQIVYVNRFKEEVYKGRSIKKANQEASKRSNLLTLDSGIVLAFSGLMMYALGGTSLKPMGVVLFFGAVFTLLFNLLVFKLLMYLGTNSTNLQSKYKVFNIDEEKVPNILSSEEKPTYEAPYEKVDFTKKKSVVSIVLGALSVAALTCIIVFGAISPTKSPLNVQNAVRDTTVIYTSVRADSESPVIYDGDSYVSYVLKDTKYANVKGIAQEVEVKKVSQYVYENSEDNKTETYYFFTLIVDEKLSEQELYDIQRQINEENLIDFGYGSDELTYTIVRNSQELIYTPSQGYVALATGLSIIGISLYFAFRFRPSRGIAVCAVATGSALIAYGSIVAMHFIGTTALTSLAMPLVAITVLLGSLFFLSTEKAMLKEGNLILTPELRKEMMVKSLGKSASALFIFMLICVYVIINFFGFGVENSAILFASAIIGEVVGVVAMLCVMGPLASVLEKAFSKIHLPKIKWFHKEKAKQQVKRNSSEPEETIFIGIND